MQLIVELPVDAEEYVSRAYQREIVAPAACPHCQANAALQALGYYLRNITGKQSAVLRLSIRRFRCRTCGKTVSVLPAFAQPYRLIHNRAIHRFFCDQRPGGEAKPWRVLLRRYWRKFSWWVSQAGAVPHRQLSRDPPPRCAAAWWKLIVAVFGNMVVATQALVTDSQVTLFGRYRCHRPNASPGQG